MRDLHIHTAFSDGRDAPEDMVEEALRRGLTEIGFSDHSHAAWDECGMSSEGTEGYRAEIRRLKEKYRGRIRIRLGLGRDYYSDDRLEYDYVIGSVHGVRMPDGHVFCVDWQPERMEADIHTYFGGDWYALAEAYYRAEADVVRQTGCDIIGHFDLMTKYNEQRRWFDPAHPRYVRAWQDAAERLLATGKVFEINTGALSRGYRTEPYPAAPIRAWLREQGAKMILSSDAHRKEHIAFSFEKYEDETELADDLFRK